MNAKTEANVKQELQKLNDRLDKYRRKLAQAEQRRNQELIVQFSQELEATTKKIADLKGQQTRQVNSKAESIKALAFHRELTKAEQADMGKLKKSVRGLVVVHPLTALGRDIGVKVVTGFAPAEF